MFNRVINIFNLINLKIDRIDNKSKNKNNYKYDLIKNKNFHLLFIGTCST